MMFCIKNYLITGWKKLYYRSNVLVKPNQRVIITILDEFEPIKRDLKKYVGAVSKEDSDLISKVVEEGRKVDIDEW